MSKVLVAASDPLDASGLDPFALARVRAQDIVNQASDHGVLPLLVYRATKNRLSVWNVLGDAAQNEIRVSAAFSMMLRHHAHSLLEQMKDLLVAMVKGETFGRLLYPSPSLRPFTDIDMLVALPQLSKLFLIFSPRTNISLAKILRHPANKNGSGSTKTILGSW